MVEVELAACCVVMVSLVAFPSTQWPLRVGRLGDCTTTILSGRTCIAEVGRLSFWRMEFEPLPAVMMSLRGVSVRSAVCMVGCSGVPVIWS